MMKNRRASQNGRSIKKEQLAYELAEAMLENYDKWHSWKWIIWDKYLQEQGIEMSPVYRKIGC